MSRIGCIASVYASMLDWLEVDPFAMMTRMIQSYSMDTSDYSVKSHESGLVRVFLSLC